MKQSIVAIAKIVLFSIVFNCYYWPTSSAPQATSSNSSAVELEAKLLASVAEVDPCLIKVIYSFLYDEALPPSSLDGLKTHTCRTQEEGFKCLKEKSRALPAILKRGLQTLISTRQKHHKKFCGSGAKLEHQKAFVEAGKCMVEKKLATYKSLDRSFANNMIAIRDRNFNDSSQELKYLCCNLLTFKKAYVDSMEPGCSKENKAYVEEMINTIIPSDLSFLCDDDDKYVAKVCPGLDKLKVGEKFSKGGGNSPTVVAFYLIATLGEPSAVRR